MHKNRFAKVILNYLESASEKQLKIILVFVSSYMKATKLKEPMGDEEWNIIVAIYHILRRNPDEEFLRKVLTRAATLEKVMYGSQQGKTED